MGYLPADRHCRPSGPLFPLSSTCQVFDRIAAPTKDQLVVDSNVHGEHIGAVPPPLPSRVHNGVLASAS